MAITLADFNKIWASTSPLTPYSFSEANYKQGWNFIGSTPPARQMWDFLQKNNDEKMQYLANNYLPLSGGTMTGPINGAGVAIQCTRDNSWIGIAGGSDKYNGAYLLLNGINNSGTFEVTAKNTVNSAVLEGKPNGTLTWGGNNVITASNYSNYVLPLSGGTMTGTIIEEQATPSTRISFRVRYSDIERGVAPSTTREGFALAIGDKNDDGIGGIYTVVGSNGSVTTRIYSTWAYNGTTVAKRLEFYNNANGTYSFYPSTDNDITLGASNSRWEQLYAGTATINTSDERLKDNIEAIPDEVLDAWGEVNWYQYQFKDSIAEKGENARLHTGAIAQRIKSVFESHNLDANRYGLLCYDEWEAEEEQKDEDGNVVQEAREAGNRYSLRYEEALCMEASYQRRRADRLEARIEALEKLLMK